MGYDAPASFAKSTKIRDSINLGKNSSLAITELLKNWLLFTDVIKNATKVVKETDDEGILGFLTDLLQLQEKNSGVNTEPLRFQ